MGFLWVSVCLCFAFVTPCCSSDGLPQPILLRFPSRAWTGRPPEEEAAVVSLGWRSKLTSVFRELFSRFSLVAPRTFSDQKPNQQTSGTFPSNPASRSKEVFRSRLRNTWSHWQLSQFSVPVFLRWWVVVLTFCAWPANTQICVFFFLFFCYCYWITD